MNSLRFASFACALFPLLAACSTTPSNENDKSALASSVAGAIDSFKAKDPGIDKFFKSAKGYAVFPSVGKGGIGVGGAYGRGMLFEDGVAVGYCDLTQATIGLQLGGQAYREIIFFQNDAEITKFRAGNFAVAAQASAVVVEAGASTTADYKDGVVVFTMAKAGLMGEATIGGQKFSFEPK